MGGWDLLSVGHSRLWHILLGVDDTMNGTAAYRSEHHFLVNAHTSRHIVAGGKDLYVDNFGQESGWRVEDDAPDSRDDVRGPGKCEEWGQYDRNMLVGTRRISKCDTYRGSRVEENMRVTIRYVA